MYRLLSLLGSEKELEIKIDFVKFTKYAEEVEGFEIDVIEDKVEIRFHPLNPDALNHFDDKANVTIIIEGKLREGILVIEKMYIREFNEVYDVDREYMEHFLGPWLEAIDHSID